MGVGGLGCWRAWVWEGLAVGSFCEGMAALESGGGWYAWGARSHMHALVHTCHGGWDLLGRRSHAWLGLTAPDTSRVPLQATRWLDEERVHACLPCRTRAAESLGVSSPHRWQDPGRTQNPRHDSRIAKVTAVSQGAKAVLRVVLRTAVHEGVEERYCTKVGEREGRGVLLKRSAGRLHERKLECMQPERSQREWGRYKRFESPTVYRYRLWMSALFTRLLESPMCNDQSNCARITISCALVQLYSMILAEQLNLNTLTAVTNLIDAHRSLFTAGCPTQCCRCSACPLGALNDRRCTFHSTADGAPHSAARRRPPPRDERAVGRAAPVAASARMQHLVRGVVAEHPAHHGPLGRAVDAHLREGGGRRVS